VIKPTFRTSVCNIKSYKQGQRLTEYKYPEVYQPKREIMEKLLKNLIGEKLDELKNSRPVLPPSRRGDLLA
jgi:hypothetical protein